MATRSSRRCSTRARTSHTARAPRESRAAARATPASGAIAAAGTHIRNNRHVRLRACVRMRHVACAMARRVVSRDARALVGQADVTHTPRRRARREGGEEHQHHHTPVVKPHKSLSSNIVTCIVTLVHNRHFEL